MTLTRGPEPDAGWFDVVALWLKQREDLLVAYTPAGCGGSTGYFFCRSVDELKDIVARVPEAARLIVYRQHSLDTRGVVDDSFITEAKHAVPDGKPFLLLSLRGRDYAYGLDGCRGDSHDELQMYLDERVGESVTLGVDPDAQRGEGDEIHAYKGGLVGAY